MPINFVFPEFLFASLFISIPIIVHLFNFRKFKKVYFTNVKFLKELQTETRQRSQLKHLLVLLARILTILFLVFAFAQPFVPVKNAGPIADQRVISVFIDNSYSMMQEGSNGSLIDEAKVRAEAIAMAYAPSDRFHLLTQDFEGRHQRLMSRDEFIESIQEVIPTPSIHYFHEIVKRQNDILSDFESSARKIYYLSDLQKSGIKADELGSDTLSNIHIIPISGEKFRNLSIDTCFVNSPAIQPGARVELTVRVKNYSSSDENQIPLKLVVNGSQRAVSSLDIAAGMESEEILSFTVNESGWQNCVISINDHPVTYDDEYYLSFLVSESISVLGILSSGSNSDIKAVFATDSYFNYLEVDAGKVDYGNLNQYDLIILQGLNTIPSGLSATLNELVRSGGNLCIIPGKNADLSSYQVLLSGLGANYLSGIDSQFVKIGSLDTRNDLFRDVFEKSSDNMDMPWVKKRYLLSLNTRISGENLMTYSDGQVFLKKFNSGAGKVYLFSNSLLSSESNFRNHALFVPVFLRLALLSRMGSGQGFIIGRDKSLALPFKINLQGEKVVHLVNSENKFEIIPEIRGSGKSNFLEIYDQLKDAGIYKLQHNNSELWNYSFNYDRRESNPALYSVEEFKQLIHQAGGLQMNILEGGVSNFEKFISQSDKGISLWKLCLLLALVFIGMEVSLIKYMKS